jgi:hypothetical protein
MTTKLEEIIESLNLKLQRGIINEDDFKVLKRLVIQYEDYINEIGDKRLFVIGLVTLRKIGYDEKDISIILLNIISKFGINKIDKLLFEVSAHIYERYYKKLEEDLRQKLELLRKIPKSSPNIDNILNKLNKLKVLLNDDDKEHIENIKKCNMPSLNHIYDTIQNPRSNRYIERIENIKKQIYCTVKNLEYIKNNLENIEKDLRYAKKLKEILNIKKELDVYSNRLLDILNLLDVYKQSYIKFKEEYLPRLLFEGLHYIKEYRNVNLNKNYEQNILYH